MVPVASSMVLPNSPDCRGCALEEEGPILRHRIFPVHLGLSTGYGDNFRAIPESGMYRTATRVQLPLFRVPRPSGLNLFSGHQPVGCVPCLHNRGWPVEKDQAKTITIRYNFPTFGKATMDVEITPQTQRHTPASGDYPIGISNFRDRR